MNFYFSTQEQDGQIATAIIEKINRGPIRYFSEVGQSLGHRLFTQLVVYAAPLAQMGESDARHSYDRSYNYGQLIGMDIMLQRHGIGILADVCNLPPLEVGISVDPDNQKAVASELADFYQNTASGWLNNHTAFGEIAPVAALALQLPESHQKLVACGLGFAAFLGEEAPTMLMNENLWPASLEKISSN